MKDSSNRGSGKVKKEAALGSGNEEKKKGSLVEKGSGKGERTQFSVRARCAQVWVWVSLALAGCGYG